MGNIFTKDSNSTLKCADVRSSNRGSCISLKDMIGPAQARKVLGDSYQVHDGNFAFLSTALAKLHKELYEPIIYTTYQDDIDIEVGGGFVDYVEFFTVDYQGIANDMRNLFGNNGNLIPRVNASMDQKRVNVHTFELAYDIRFIDLEKMSQLTLQKSLKQIYEDAIVSGWDLFAQQIAYNGIKGGTGLFNSTDVLINTIDNTGATKGFQGLSDANVLSWFNGVFATYLKNSNMNPNVLPDTFLVPTFVGSDLSGRTNSLYTNSLRRFITEFNLGKDETDDKLKVTIKSRADLDTLGTGGKGRIVAYKKNKKFVRLDIPYPMQHYITQPNMERMGYTTLFAGQISDIQMPYNMADEFGIVSYWDFIA